MRKFYVNLWGAAALALSIQWSAFAAGPLKIVPSQWGIYSGAFPDFPEGTYLGMRARIQELELKLNKNLALITYSNDWVDGAFFPWDALDQIQGMNRTPLIRIMPRSTRTQNTGADPIYSLDRFLLGHHDQTIREWARNARLSGSPLMVEWAPEANGRWYPWNGLWAGGGTTNMYGDPRLADGPEKYRDVYRRVVNLFKMEGATNVTFVFHVDSQPQPQEDWNKMAGYYPGDEYVDWLGLSVFGAQYPWEYWETFSNLMEVAYPEFSALSATKPLMISEFGVIEDEFDVNRKAKWIEDALTSIIDDKYPRIKSVNYWHESSWIPSNKNNLRIDSSPQALHAYQKLINHEVFLSDVEVTWP